jgi:hypothetical protein
VIWVVAVQNSGEMGFGWAELCHKANSSASTNAQTHFMRAMPEEMLTPRGHAKEASVAENTHCS